MRVRISIGRAAMGGPAGMSDARMTAQCVWRWIQAALQVHQPTGLLHDAQTTALVDDGDACGVVSAVLQTTQPPEHQRKCLTRTRVPHDATHGRNASRCAVSYTHLTLPTKRIV